jgi:hypothetical protein
MLPAAIVLLISHPKEQARWKNFCQSLPEASTTQILECDSVARALEAMGRFTVMLAIVDCGLEARARSEMRCRNPFLRFVALSDEDKADREDRVRQELSLVPVAYEFQKKLARQRGSWH